MHPDAGAIIGISLAGSVLIVAILFLCMLNLPCCKETLKPGGGNGRRIPPTRPSTASRSQILNFPFSGSTHSLHTLSALDLHNNNQAQPSHFLNGSSGLANPLWQLQCNSCGSLVTASQHSLNHHHQCSNQIPCHYYHHHEDQAVRNATGHSSNNANVSTFQYGSPQLVSPTESPPPYPGTPSIVRGRSNEMIVEPSSSNDLQVSTLQVSPPPYYPKII